MKQIVHLTAVHRPFDHRIFHKECRSLARAGYQVTLVAPADFREEERDGVRILGTPRPRSRWGRPRTWWRLLRQVIDLKPDLVHLHDPELLALAPLLRLSLGPRLRIVYDVHEYFVDSIAHKVWIPPLLRTSVSWLAQNAERWLGKAADGLVFVIEGQAQTYLHWRAAKVVVHNYPAAETFANPVALPEFPADRFRLIYIGSLYFRRGILTMLEALAQVVPTAPDVLLILGGSFESDRFRTQVEAFIADHSLDRHVMLMGWIEHAQLKDYLASADAAWLPGLPLKQYQRPGISTKLLECMLMGLPIVSSDNSNRRSFIDEAKCGFCVTPDDPMAHAEAIQWLYHHPEERRAMGARGRQLVLDKYTWETEAPILSGFYAQLLSKGER